MGSYKINLCNNKYTSCIENEKKITLGISESKFGSEFGVYHEGVWMSVQEIYKSFYE